MKARGLSRWLGSTLHRRTGAAAVALACLSGAGTLAVSSLAGEHPSPTRLAAPAHASPRSTAGATPGPERPSAHNTGVPAGTLLTPYRGNLVITTPGARYDALDVHGFVIVRARDVTITRSVIRGGIATGNVGLVTVVDAKAKNFLIEDSELVPEHPSVWIDGIKGWNYTARRVNIHGTVDTAKVYGAGHVSIERSWLHDTRRFDHDPNQNGTPTHNDGIQVLAGTDIRIIGNSIDGAWNAALQVTENHGEVDNLEFSDNWVDGGGCTVNLNKSPDSFVSHVRMERNRFGGHTRIHRCAMLVSESIEVTASNNVWANGRPALVRTVRAGSGTTRS